MVLPMSLLFWLFARSTRTESLRSTFSLEGSRLKTHHARASVPTGEFPMSFLSLFLAFACAGCLVQVQHMAFSSYLWKFRRRLEGHFGLFRSVRQMDSLMS